MEQQLQEILDLSLDIHYYYDVPESKFLYVNPAIKDHFGITPEETIGKDNSFLLDLIHPEDRENFESHWNTENFDNLNFSSSDYRYRTRSEKFIWYNDTHRYVRNQEGSIISIIGCLRDITDLKVVEILKSTTKERLNLAMEAASDSIWEWKVTSNRLFFDARFYSILGYDAYEFPDNFSEWEKRMHPDDRKNAFRLLRECATGKSKYIHIEYRILSGTGEWKWLLCRAKVSGINDDGRIIKIIGTQTDITNLKEINEKLIESEEKFLELAENTHDAFWLRDEKQFLYTNPSFEKLWGKNGKEITEIQDFEDLIHPEDRGRYSSWKHLSTFSANVNYSEQFRIIKADGSVRWLWSRIHPVFNSEGKVYRIAGIATDITELKETEQALLRAKEKAMESDNLKSAFLANISHEIRTPMNGILGFIELLKDDALTRETREQYINIISKSSKQLLQIINDIIDISKIEANQLSIDIKESNINLITRDIFLFYQRDNLAVKKGLLEIRLELPLNDDEAVILTDESRLRQILMNILDNAVKFTAEGEIVIGYRLSNSHTVEFYISDTGIGIPKNQYHLVFERFRQVDGSATRKYGGTGLGLSICQGLAKLLGGSISFESEEGKGTRFFVTLPYKPASQPYSESDDLMNDVIPDWGNKNILIVEDDEINYELLKTMLEYTNAGIVRAESGEDAIRIFSGKHNINLILMDIRLPGINGYQVLKSIKKQDPCIPVIAQTAFAMAEDNRKCLEQGFDDYIAKPIHRKLLFKIIKKQFNGSAHGLNTINNAGD